MSAIRSDPAPCIRTKRLELRAHKLSNLEAIHTWYNDREIQWYSAESSADVPIEASRQRIARWMSNQNSTQLHLAIYQRKDNRFIGFTHLMHIDRDTGSAKVGIVLGEKKLWGRGLGTETLTALVDYAFHALELKSIEAETFSFNDRALGMLKNVGFVATGRHSGTIERNGQCFDELVYRAEGNGWCRLGDLFDEG